MLCVTSYFNPCKYKTKKINYFEFRKNLEKQNINLVTLELGLNENDFEIKDSIKFIGNPFFWQKENLLLKSLKLKPQEDKIVWLDCDIIFENKDWHKECEEKLEKYDVLQLFEEVSFLNISKKPEKIFKSAIYEFYNNLNFKNGFPNQGHPGFAWAAKKRFFNFFQENLVIGNDVVYMSSIVKDYWIIESWKILDELKIKILEWCRKNNDNAKFHYVKGKINHLWHGSWKNRQYNNMNLINHYKQIKIKDGFFESDQKILDLFRTFMKKRNEDGMKLL